MTVFARARQMGARLPRRAVATVAVVGLAGGAIVAAGGGTAAAATPPNAQAVGRFLDGTVGGSPIQKLVNLEDARAKAAPNTEVRNPLTVKVLNQLTIPLGNSLKLPGGQLANLGAANQIAIAKTNQHSLGGSGAVLDSGGVSLGGTNNTPPQNAKITISGKALGSVTVPGQSAVAIPGAGSLPKLPGGSFASLGGVTGSIGALAALAQTAKGGDVITPRSGLASLKLSIGSPALAAVLNQLSTLLDPSQLNSLLGGLTIPSGSLSSVSGSSGPLGSLLGGASAPSNPLTSTLSDLLGGLSNSATANSACALTDPASSAPIGRDGISLDPKTATITVNVGTMLKTILGQDITHLNTSNFDVISFVAKNLPTILSKGLTRFITNITDSLQSQFTACASALGGATVASGITDLLNQLKTPLLAGVNTLSGQFDAGSAPLGQLADGLKNLVDIGLNVQHGPGIQPKNTKYPFTSALSTSPDQSRTPVKNQTLVRALEVQLLNASSLPSGGAIPTGGITGTLPGVPGAPSVSPSGGAAVVALGNAAVGPSHPAAAAAPTSASSAPGGLGALPTAIPAGAAGDSGGAPILPIVAVLMLLSVGGVSLLHLRGRSRAQH